MFTEDWSLTEASTYPQPGAIRCEALAQWRDSSGAELVRVTTERPDDIESTEGLFEFIVPSSEVSTA